MNIPLIARPIEHNGSQKLIIWYNGQWEIVDPPCEPYIYCENQEHFSHIEDYVHNAMTLSTLESHPVWKYSFPLITDIMGINKIIKDQPVERFVYENHIPFIHRVAVDYPDFFPQFKNTRPLKIGAIDIEQWCKDKIFPGDDKPIISIAYNDKAKLADEKTEAEALWWLMETIQKEDPDIITGYNCNNYDLPRIIARCKVHEIPYQKLSRGDMEPWIFKRMGEPTIRLEGRIVYDIYWRSARRDQTLFGVRRGAKDLAKHFKFDQMFDESLIDRGNMYQYVGTEDLKMYNLNDTYNNKQFFMMYFPDLLALGEYLKIPLVEIVNCTSSFPAFITHMRGLKKSNIICDGRNIDRHGDIIGGREKKKFQAGYIFTYYYCEKCGDLAVMKDKNWFCHTCDKTTGIKKIYKPVFKIDFKGMYSSINITFNISPDTTKIVGYQEYKDIPIRVERHRGYNLFTVPDANIRRNVIIRVDTTKDGFLKQDLIAIRDMRNELKQRMRRADKKEKEKLNSRQWAVKVLANVPTGANGNSYFLPGDVSVFILTTGIARNAIKALADYIFEHYGNVVISIHTDGIYLKEELPLDELQNFVETYVADMKIGECTMSVEPEYFTAGLFLKQNNYVLRKEDGTLEPHGGLFKSRAKARVYINGLSRLSRGLLEGEKVSKLVSEVLRFEGTDIDDFSLSRTMRQSIDKYEGRNDLTVQLYRQEKEFVDEINVGYTFQYIASTDRDCRYKILRNVKSIRDVDLEYYRAGIRKVVEELDILVQRTSLEDFF